VIGAYGRLSSRLRDALASRSLLRNSVYIMLTTGVNSALGYLFWLVIARTYAAYDVGVAGALIAAMTVVAALADLGTSTALIQRLPSQRTDEAWSRTLTASVSTATVAGLAFGIVAAVVVLPSLSHSLSVVDSSAWYVILFVGGVVIWSLSVVSDYLFVAERRSENMLRRNTLFGVAKLVIVVVIAAAGDRSTLGIFAAWVAGCALSLAAAYVLLMPRLGRRYRPSLTGVAREVRNMATSFAGNYFITLGFLLTTFLLPLIVLVRLGAEQTAYFYVAWLLGGAFFTVTASVGSALFAEGSHDTAALAQQTRSAVRISVALLAPLMVVFFVAGGAILGLFGPAYADNATTLLLLLTASAVPDGITGLYIARVRAEGRLAFPAVTSMAIAALTLVGAWLLLPSMDLAGAGVAFIVAHCLGSVACLVDAFLIRRRAPLLTPNG
jgi:O-antigen/teichoic acid export membrane protein